MMAEPETPAPVTWWELRIRPHAAPQHDAGPDRLIARLLDISPSGWVEQNGDYAVYFPDPDAAGRARSAVCDLGEVLLKSVSDDGWQAWRRSFRSHRVGERLLVCPPWEAPLGPVSGVLVVIEPGLAFGTGEHPTTAGCLRYLEKLVTGGETVLDVGTGSGILAIAAALLGAGCVTGLEVDPLACKSARANLARNPASGGRVEVVEGNAVRLLAAEGEATGGGLGGGSGEGDGAGRWCGVDIVSANLTSALIRHLAPGLAHAARPGGHLVASGIGRQAGPEVIQSLEQVGFRVTGRTYEAGWVTLLAKREG